MPAPIIALRALGGSPSDETAWYELYAAIRAEELAMESWDPALRARILRQQFDAQRRSYAERFAGADRRLILVGDTAIGWLIVDRNGPEVRCVDIALVPGARQQGVGTLIIRALQREAAIDERPMRIEVLRHNVRARALYERLGFRTTAETDTHAAMEWRAAPLPADRAAFEAQIDTMLRIDVAGAHVPLRIAEVVPRRPQGGMDRYSVYLHGPAHAGLPQDSYLVHHDVLGSFVLFIVPVIGSDRERIVYEACFSRPVASASTP